MRHDMDGLPSPASLFDQRIDTMTGETTCPECGDLWSLAKLVTKTCILSKPMMIAIPAGQHIHINCPVHGSHRIDGPNHTL